MLLKKSKMILMLMMTVFIWNTGFAQSYVEQHGQLKVSGNRIVDKNDKVVTMRGMSLYCWADQGTQFYTATAINRLVSEWKCTVIRIPVLPANTSYAASIAKTAIKACIANGVYAILDWHSMGRAQDSIDLAIDFFKSMATLYGNTPNLIYETWNEPVSENWSTIKSYHTKVIEAIRSIDPDNIILCGNPLFDQKPLDAANDPIKTSTNIAYTVHFYAATHKASVRSNVSDALAKGVAVFASEYGTCASNGAGSIDETETKAWWSFLDQNCVGSTNWSVAALDETSAAFKIKTNPRTWTDADLKPSGVLVKAYLVDKNKGEVAVRIPYLARGENNTGKRSYGYSFVADNIKADDAFMLNGARVKINISGKRPAHGYYAVKLDGNRNVSGIDYVK